MSTPRALLHNPADVGDIGPGGVDLPLSWPLRCLSIRNPWRSSRYYPLLVFDNGLKLRWIRFDSEHEHDDLATRFPCGARPVSHAWSIPATVGLEFTSNGSVFWMKLGGTPVWTARICALDLGRVLRGCWYVCDVFVSWAWRLNPSMSRLLATGTVLPVR